MLNKNLLCDSAVLMIRQGDNSDYCAEYDEYVLTNIRTVERFGTTAEMTEKNTVDIYFFDSVSECTDQSGAKVPLPHPGYGDHCSVTLMGDEKVLRVMYAEYHACRNGSENNLSHTKIRLG